MSITQQPDALNLEEFRAKVTHAAREPLLARIAELESQLEAIGAGGVEPLRKPASVTATVQLPDCRGRVMIDGDGECEIAWRGGMQPDNETNIYTEQQVRSLLAGVSAPAAQAQMLRKALEYIEAHSFGGTDTLALIDELRKFLSATPQAQKGETT